MSKLQGSMKKARRRACQYTPSPTVGPEAITDRSSPITSLRMKVTTALARLAALASNPPCTAYEHKSKQQLPSEITEVRTNLGGREVFAHCVELLPVG
jgi:hypothetical protein